MIPSRSPQRIKQANALAKVRFWRGNFKHVKNLLKEAIEAAPLSSIQVYNVFHDLETKFRSEQVSELRAMIRVVRP